MPFLHNLVSHPDPSTNSSAFVDFTCSHCNESRTGMVVSETGHPDGLLRWVMCSICGKGSVLHSSEYDADDFSTDPPTMFGPNLSGLTPSVAAAYDEARRALGADVLIGCESVCRKILMNIAVDKGADEGKTFEWYVNFLVSEEYVTKSMKPWVDQIRKDGNEANHKIDRPTRERVENTLNFTAQLLRLVYEMEEMTRAATASQDKKTGMSTTLAHLMILSSTTVVT